MKWILPVLLSFMLASCVILPRVAFLSSSSVDFVFSRIEYVDQYNQEVSISNPPEELFLIFSAIPGRIFGPPTKNILFFGHLENETKFQLNLQHQIFEVEKMISSIESFAQENIVIRPRSTKFLRFGTFAYNPSTRMSSKRVGFIDSTTRESLFLMYFDRSCTIQGTEHAQGVKYNYDIEVEAKGFYWVKVHKFGKYQYILKGFVPKKEVILSIMVMNSIYV